MDTVRNGTFGLSNTNKMVRFYPGATGLKTGFTSGAGYCLSASAQREGLGLIAVVMGCETSQSRFAACKQLLDYGFANYALVVPELPEGTVPVKLGRADTVQAVPAEDAQLLVDKAQKNQVQIQTVLEESVTAPVSKGQRLGMLTVKVGEQTVRQVPLVAREGVEKLTWWDLVLQMLGKIAMAKG
jgi:D-alanyl-D-alanine carboxypeptidase (penicillin-binding protein 5/6)